VVSSNFILKFFFTWDASSMLSYLSLALHSHVIEFFDRFVVLPQKISNDIWGLFVRKFYLVFSCWPSKSFILLLLEINGVESTPTCEIIFYLCSTFCFNSVYKIWIFNCSICMYMPFALSSCIITAFQMHLSYFSFMSLRLCVICFEISCLFVGIITIWFS